jgi:hypothetical protein
LFDKCREKIIEAAKRLALEMGNPVFVGWVVEFEFLKKCLTSPRLIPLQNTEGVDNSVEFKASYKGTPATLQKRWLTERKELKVGEVLFFQPSKWNQGTYDFFTVEVLEGDGKQYTVEVVFYQITTAGKHSLKSEYLKTAINRINESGAYKVQEGAYKICFVFPKGNPAPRVTPESGMRAPKVNISYRCYESTFAEIPWMPPSAESQ